MPDPATVEAAHAAYEAYLDAQPEPPFDENHHRFHTPARPVEGCAVCSYQGWYISEDADRDVFAAGWAAAREQLAKDVRALADELASRDVSGFPIYARDEHRRDVASVKRTIALVAARGLLDRDLLDGPQ